MARTEAQASVFADRALRDGLHILRGFLFFVVHGDDEFRPADGGHCPDPTTASFS